MGGKEWDWRNSRCLLRVRWMMGRQRNKGHSGLTRGCVQLVLKKGWCRETTERGEGRLPPPHTRLRLLDVFLEGSRKPTPFFSGERKTTLGFVLSKDHSGGGWWVGKAGGKEAGRERSCGGSEASTSPPLPNYKSNKLLPQRGLEVSPRS